MAVEVRSTIYGLINADFSENRLRDICDPHGGIQTGPFGSQLHQEDYVDEGIPIVTVEHLGENRIVHRALPLVSDTDRKRLSKYTLQEGDIVFSRVGSVDRRALVQSFEDGWMFSGRCLRVRPDQHKVDASYLSYFFGLPAFKEHIRAVAVGATMPSLNSTILGNVIVFYPADVGEQRAISNILRTLDDKIELNRRMNETLEAMARALFKSWFVKFDPVRAKAAGLTPTDAPALYSLFPSTFDPNESPTGWHHGTLLDLCELKRGYDLPTAQRSPGSYPIVSSSGISGFHSAPMAQGPGVVTGRYGTIGEVYFVNEAYWPLNTALYVRDFKSNCPRFVFYALQQIDFLQYSDKAAVPGINRNHLHQAPMIIPPHSVQQAFEKCLTPVWAKQEANKVESATLTSVRNTLLPKLISGELRVRAAEKIIEAVA